MKSDIQLIIAETGHLLTPVNIDGVRTIFLVDTGSSSSVLDADFITKLKDESINKLVNTEGFSPGEIKGELQQFQVNNVSIGDLDLISISAVIQPIKLMLTGIYTSPVEGILGLDALTLIGLSLNLKESKLVNLSQLNYVELLHRGYSSIEIQMSESGLPYINVEINNQLFGLILDSGANELMFDKNKVMVFNFFDIEYPKDLIAISENGETRQLGLIKEAKIKIANIDLKIEILIDDFSHILTQINENISTEIIGVIGFNVLANLNGIINFEKNELYIKIPKSGY
jgi:predicted aspartyl protease